MKKVNIKLIAHLVIVSVLVVAITLAAMKFGFPFLTKKQTPDAALYIVGGCGSGLMLFLSLYTYTIGKK